VQGRWPLGLPGRAAHSGTPDSPVCDAPESHSRPVVPGTRCPSCNPTLDQRRFQGRRVAGGLGSGMHRGFENMHLVDSPGADGMRLALGVCAAGRQRRFGTASWEASNRDLSAEALDGEGDAELRRMRRSAKRGTSGTSRSPQPAPVAPISALTRVASTFPDGFSLAASPVEAEAEERARLARSM
jgi:hypothetical protein